MTQDFSKLTSLMNIYAEFYENQAVVEHIFAAMNWAIAMWQYNVIKHYNTQLRLVSLEMRHNSYRSGSGAHILHNLNYIPYFKSMVAKIDCQFLRQAIQDCRWMLSSERPPPQFEPRPVNFYYILNPSIAIKYWYLRPLWTSLKWLLDYTPVGVVAAQNFATSQSTLLPDLVTTGNFSALSDRECDELWYYLVDHLGITPSRSFDYLREQCTGTNRMAVEQKYSENCEFAHQLETFGSTNPNSFRGLAKPTNPMDQAAVNSYRRDAENIQQISHLARPSPHPAPTIFPPSHFLGFPSLQPARNLRKIHRAIFN